MKYDPRQLMSFYNRLAPRERILLSVAVVALLLISLYSFVWEPLQSSRAQFVTRIAKKEKEVSEMQRERDVYLDVLRQLEANQSSLSEGDANFNLFSYLQNVISQAVSREHITSMNPSNKTVSGYQEDLVEIKLTQVNLEQLVDLLYRVEKGDHPLRFGRLQIKKRTNDVRNFDVNATVSLLKAVNS